MTFSAAELEKIAAATAKAETEGWAEWIRTDADKHALLAGCWFDPKPGQRYAQFCRKFLRHTKGPLKGQPFELLPWEFDLASRLLGWKRADGKRRFRKAYISTAKKSGKTTFIATLAIYLLLTEGARSELYSAATEREQASIVFREAAAMIRASAGLTKQIKSKPSTKTLIYEDSFYRALSADAGGKEGLDASIIFVDELHAWADRALFDALAYAGRSRQQPLQIIITIAGNDLTTVWGEEYTRAKRWLEGAYTDDSYLAAIWEADPDDDWTSPATWAKANPSLGITVPIDEVQRECDEAIEIPSAQPRFKRYACNLLTSLEAGWFDMKAWDECPHTIDLESLSGKECWGGLDLSSVNDLTALVLCFNGPDDTTILLPRFWLPLANLNVLAREHKVSYRSWLDAGFLHATDGNCVDYDQIVDSIKVLSRLYILRQLGIDRAFQGQAVETRLMQAGCDVVPVGQGWVSQSLPAKELERLVLGRKVNHGNHPVLRWNASNVVAKRDDADNISITKKRSRGKIDGIAATLMALLCRSHAGAPMSGDAKYSQPWQGDVILV